MNHQSTIRLDQFGQAVWKHKNNRSLFAERSYDWVDRVIVLDETEGRKVVDDVKFSTFDFTDWTPMTVEEYQRVDQNYKDIYKE